MFDWTGVADIATEMTMPVAPTASTSFGPHDGSYSRNYRQKAGGDQATIRWRWMDSIFNRYAKRADSVRPDRELARRRSRCPRLVAASAMRWVIPKAFGGDELESLELHLRYEAIAAASLSTALILTQRDSAAALIDASDNQPLRETLLPRLASNEFFTTVGVAQLTTSRQGGPPVLRARRTEGAWIVNGLIPVVHRCGSIAIYCYGGGG